MKKILTIILFVFISCSVFAEGKLWVKVYSNNVNEVFFSFAKGNSKEQKVDKEWINEPAGYFYLDNSIIKHKTGSELQIVLDRKDGYKKENGSGKWIAMSQSEKDIQDSSNINLEYINTARSVAIASLRELINEKIAPTGKDITEQELIDRIKIKMQTK